MDYVYQLVFQIIYLLLRHWTEMPIHDVLTYVGTIKKHFHKDTI